ncbi:MAG: DNA polymerase III subunit alpha [Planctomycetaceae bacterium]|jgi:DNA polymerase-3 subunit alpha|nr:DNA polymerase III subunit alpha [Planctomycetaceae bacterium]
MDFPFIHLHCHSHYSLLDGAGKIEDLLKRAKDLEMPALALTDHGNLYGALEFYQKAKEAGIKPIIGFEAYIAPRSRTEKSGTAKESNYHLTLLAMNKTGYKNLLRLSSAAYLEGMHYKPRIDKSLLQEYNEGLICLSGCASSELSRTLLHAENNNVEQAVSIINWYRELFGDRYYLEIQDNGLEIQKIILEGTVRLSRELGVPTVATNDVHYVYQHDWEAQDILLCVNTNKLRVDEKRMRMDSDQFFLRSGREMLRAMPAHEDAIQRTMEIADRVVDIDLELGKRFFPVFTPPDGLSSDDYLRKLCLEGLAKRYANNPKRYKDGQFSEEVLARLDRELAVVKKLGFPNYFLIVWDFVRVAEERGIHRTARGSGVGALVCYALNLSHVCPLEFDLLFERFLDENRKEAPDIDIDFDQNRRGEVLDYVKQQYGEENVAQIGVFGTMAARQSIKDVGRVLNMPIPFVESVTKLIPDEPKMKINKALDANEELKKRYENEQDIKELIDYAKQLEGLARQAGVHACAVVIADKPLIEYVPLQRVKEGPDFVTQWAMGDVEKAGLLKMDFLGLRNLTILAQAIDIIKETTGETINPYQFPLDDKKTYELLCRGETKGIFQLEGGGIRELLQRMKPDNFRDIIATLALYRPGPLEGGMVDQYVAVKHGRAQAYYEHDVMKDVLAETNGVMVYQEQIMRILNRLGKIPLGNSYTCIKAISKKKEKEINTYRSQFIEGSHENGLTREKAEEIFELIIKFAGYGFNKSHSTAYALIAYMTAYLKAHYPVEFMASLLCGDISKRNFTGKDSTVEHIEDCQRMGITVIPPDVNYSKQLYSVSDGKIMFALAAVKNCGDWAADKIVFAREKGGLFKNLFDFCERVDSRACSRGTVETLIKAGAFDSLGCPRSQLFRMVEQAFKSAHSAAADLAKGQQSLFSSFDETEPAAAAKPAALAGLPEISEWSDKEKAAYEKESLGFYLSLHPLKEFETIFQKIRSHHCYEAAGLQDQTNVILAGAVNDIKINATKTANKQFAMFSLEDVEGQIRSIIWPGEYEKYSHLIKSETIVFATGRVDRSRGQGENDGNFIVDALYTLEEAMKQLLRGLKITLEEHRHSVESVKKLYEILRGYPGDGTIELSVRLRNGSLAQLRSPKLRIEMSSNMQQRVIELLGKDSIDLLKMPPKKNERNHSPQWKRNNY